MNSYLRQTQGLVSHSIMVPKPSKPRALNKSHVEILFKVKEFFKLQNVAKTTSAATQVSRSTIFKIDSQNDVDTWKRQHGDKLSHNSTMVVPDRFASVFYFSRRKKYLLLILFFKNLRHTEPRIYKTAI